MTDERLKSFFGTHSDRWAEFKRDDPPYFTDVGAFISSLTTHGITLARPSVANTRIFTHTGIRGIIEDFIRNHPAHPLPLEHIALVRHISANAKIDLATLATELTTAREGLHRFADGYNIPVTLTLHLNGFNASSALELCESIEDGLLETVTFTYAFPPMTPASAAAWRVELASFLGNPRAHGQGVLLAGFPLCFAPPAQFKALLRYSLNDLKGLVGAQRRTIQSVLSERRAALPRCSACRCRSACATFTDLASHPDHDAILLPPMEDSVAFLGGSLPTSEVPFDDRLVITPPAEQGDLLAAILAGFKTLLIIDGYFYTRFPCTTFEVMTALEQGLNVFGAASIGALRAVELDWYGMTGVGLVYEALKRHPIKPYHLVAQTYTEQDAALTPPLADFLYLLDCATADGILTEAYAGQAFDVAGAIGFPLLSFDYFFERLDAQTIATHALQAYFDDKGAAHFNVKRRDALTLLTSFRGLLAKREPGTVRRAFADTCETVIGRLNRKYKSGHNLALPADWRTPTGSDREQAAGRRALSAAETCRLAEAFFADLGIVVADTSGYDPPAGSFIINIFFPALYFLGYPLSCSTGNGDVFDEALAAAYMELVERIPTHNFRSDAVPGHELDQDPLPSEILPQYANFAAPELVKHKVVADHGFVIATDIVSNRSFPIPRFAVMSMFTGTDGNAAGNTLTEAILYGLYELIERDTNRLYLFDPVCRHEGWRLRLNPAEWGDARIGTLLDRMDDKGLKPVITLLPNEFDIPCVRCRVYDINRGIESHGGTTARGNLRSAVYATLHEAYMQHISYFTGIRDDYCALQANKEARIAYENAKADLFKPAPRFLECVPETEECGSLTTELGRVIDRLLRTGIRRILVANTSPEPSFVVKSAKVIVPGLELWFVPEYQPSPTLAARAIKTRTLMEQTLRESQMMNGVKS